MSVPKPSFNPTGRRPFLIRLGAALLGFLSLLIAPLAGLFVVTDPLRRSPSAGHRVKIGALALFGEKDPPRRVPILAARQNAWTRDKEARLGAVYIQRTGPDTVRALSVVCPHAGCYVDFDVEQDRYLCPCHHSYFGLQGQVVSDRSPSPRGLDELEVEIDGNSEIWVVFQQFRSGIKEKVPLG